MEREEAAWGAGVEREVVASGLGTVETGVAAWGAGVEREEVV